MPEKHPVIGLVGPSGSGKTALMLRVMEELPDDVFPMVTVTSRPKRDETDDVFYRFHPAEEIRAMIARGEMAQYLEYAGNLYGSLRKQNDKTLAKGFGMQAYVEQGIHDLRKAGYSVVPVKITSDNTGIRDQRRVVEDRERSKTPIDYATTIHNSFAPGGLDRAVRELIAFILSLKQ